MRQVWEIPARSNYNLTMRFFTYPGPSNKPTPPGAPATKGWLVKLASLNNGLQLIGAAGGLWGNYLITVGAASGFFFWIASNAALIWLQCRTRLWALVGLHMAYLYLCVQGIVQWHAREPASIPAWVPESLLKLFEKIV